MLRVEKADPPQRGQDEVGVLRPRSAAVAGGQQGAGAGMDIRARLPPSRPAKLLVEETHRPERAGHARGLLGPRLAAVVGVQDDAPVADRPALPGVDKAHVVEPGVVLRRVDGSAGP